MNHYPELNRIIIGIQPKKGVVMFKNITLSQACEGMIRYKIAMGKSTNTILDYRNTLKRPFSQPHNTDWRKKRAQTTTRHSMQEYT